MATLAWLVISGSILANIAGILGAIRTTDEASRDLEALRTRSVVDARRRLAWGELRLAIIRTWLAGVLAAANAVAILRLATAPQVRVSVVAMLLLLLVAHVLVWLDARASRHLRREVRNIVADERAGR